jgi:hypothetical protein
VPIPSSREQKKLAFDGFLDEIRADYRSLSIGPINPGVNGGAAAASLRSQSTMASRPRTETDASAAVGASRGGHRRGQRQRRQETAAVRCHSVKPQQVNHYATTSHANQP